MNYVKIKTGNGYAYFQDTGSGYGMVNDPNILRQLSSGSVAASEISTQDYQNYKPAVTSTPQNNQQATQIQEKIDALKGQAQNAQNAGYGEGGRFAGQDIPANVLDGSYDTGNPQLNDMLLQLQQYLDRVKASGQVVNPSVELSPSQIQGFLDQASREISPYYASQIGAIKDDLTKSIDNLQKQWEIQKETDQATFKQNLATQRENNAGSGLAFSGVRGAAEEGLVSAQQRSLDLGALQTENQLGGNLRTLEGKIGSSNLPTLPTFQGSTVSATGEGGFGAGRTLNFAPTGGVSGTLPGQQTTDIQKRKNELETSAREGRVLDFYNT